MLTCRSINHIGHTDPHTPHGRGELGSTALGPAGALGVGVVPPGWAGRAISAARSSAGSFIAGMSVTFTLSP
jgi:hypothetical protein